MMLAGQMTSVPFDRTSSSGYFRMSEIIHRQRLSQAHVVRQYPAGRVLRLPPEEPREGLPLVREELDTGFEQTRLILLVRLGGHRPHRVAELLQGSLEVK